MLEVYCKRRIYTIKPLYIQVEPEDAHVQDNAEIDDAEDDDDDDDDRDVQRDGMLDAEV